MKTDVEFFTNQNQTTRACIIRIATIVTDSYRWSHLVAKWMTTRNVRRANPASTWLSCRLLLQIRTAACMTHIWRKHQLLLVVNAWPTPLSLARKRSLGLHTQHAFAWMTRGTRGGSSGPQTPHVVLLASHLLFVCLNILIYTEWVLGRALCLCVNIHVIAVYPSIVCVCVCLCIFGACADVCLQS